MMSAPSALRRGEDSGGSGGGRAGPGHDPLFTVIIRDAALRSTLVARLAMDGANMRTAQGFDEGSPASASAHNAAAVLITDQATVDTHTGGVGALLRDVRWHWVIVLMPDAAATSADPRLLYVAREDAIAVAASLRAGWRRAA